VLIIVALTPSPPVADDRVVVANRASPREKFQRDHPGSALSSASGSAIKRITAGVRAAADRRCQVSIWGLAFTLPVKSVSNEKRILLYSVGREAPRNIAPQAEHNGPMADVADLLERATGVRVSKTLPCGDDHIVLLDYYQASQSKLWANLRRVKSAGDVVWASSAPGSSDIFTNVDWRGGRLVAWTWEGFMITVDQETGKPVDLLFTK
jgi:hypothetical protein